MSGTISRDDDASAFVQRFRGVYGPRPRPSVTEVVKSRTRALCGGRRASTSRRSWAKAEIFRWIKSERRAIEHTTALHDNFYVVRVTDPPCGVASHDQDVGAFASFAARRINRMTS